jgi:hypothetical protein
MQKRTIRRRLGCVSSIIGREMIISMSWERANETKSQSEDSEHQQDATLLVLLGLVTLVTLVT